MKDKRFEVIYSQGTMDVQRILVDRKTGVHYLQTSWGYAGGLTPLLDREGKSVVGQSDYFEE